MARDLPVIGVIACARDVEGEPAQAVKHRYLEAVLRFAGAVPLIVPTNQPPANAEAIIGRLDALLLTGSNSNIAPARYGASLAPVPPLDPDRDATGAALIHAAIGAGRPVIGICRGLQEINVALGGSLADTRQGGGAARHHAPDGTVLEEMFAHAHLVEVVPGSLLHRVTGRDMLTVNSVHYQVIERLGDGLAVNARSGDGTIEAIAATGSAAPVFAVQWHPEWRPEERPHDRAFWRYVGALARGRSPQRATG